MKRLLLTLLFPSILSFAQTKDYKNFDKAVKYNKQGNIEKSIKYANKALEKWNPCVRRLHDSTPPHTPNPSNKKNRNH